MIVDPLMLAISAPLKTFLVQFFGFAALVIVLVKLVFPQLGKILGRRGASCWRGCRLRG